MNGIGALAAIFSPLMFIVAVYVFIRFFVQEIGFEKSRILTVFLTAVLLLITAYLLAPTSSIYKDPAIKPGAYEKRAEVPIFGDPATPENQDVRAARIFAGPTQYPPEDFAAYGILAFRARASLYDHDRHSMMCQAYASGLPHTTELSIPDSQQMVTVWPVDSENRAESPF